MKRRKIEIKGSYIREVKPPNDLFLNVFPGRKVMKIFDQEIADQFVEWYNKNIVK